MKGHIFYMGLALAVALSTSATQAQTGNGAPSGGHYNLNIICVPNGKKADMTNTQGHTIFVSCSGTSKINLIEGADFEVLDRNGTDGSASFQLPPADTGVITDQPGVKDECTLYNADGRSIRMAFLTATTTSAAPASACTPSSPARWATRAVRQS